MADDACETSARNDPAADGSACFSDGVTSVEDSVEQGSAAVCGKSAKETTDGKRAELSIVVTATEGDDEEDKESRATIKLEGFAGVGSGVGPVGFAVEVRLQAPMASGFELHAAPGPPFCPRGCHQSQEPSRLSSLRLPTKAADPSTGAIVAFRLVSLIHSFLMIWAAFTAPSTMMTIVDGNECYSVVLFSNAGRERRWYPPGAYDYESCDVLKAERYFALASFGGEC